MSLGWEAQKRIHRCLMQVDIINGKLWIQCSQTEESLAEEFVRRGVPKDQIVVGLRPPEMREHSEYAVV